jgi:hypothetical protein
MSTGDFDANQPDPDPNQFSAFPEPTAWALGWDTSHTGNNQTKPPALAPADAISSVGEEDISAAPHETPEQPEGPMVSGFPEKPRGWSEAWDSAVWKTTPNSAE